MQRKRRSWNILQVPRTLESQGVQLLLPLQWGQGSLLDQVIRGPLFVPLDQQGQESHVLLAMGGDERKSSKGEK